MALLAAAARGAWSKHGSNAARGWDSRDALGSDEPRMRDIASAAFVMGQAVAMNRDRLTYVQHSKAAQSL
jgi:hypothetical protein